MSSILFLSVKYVNSTLDTAVDKLFLLHPIFVSFANESSWQVADDPNLCVLVKASRPPAHNTLFSSLTLPEFKTNKDADIPTHVNDIKSLTNTNVFGSFQCAAPCLLPGMKSFKITSSRLADILQWLQRVCVWEHPKGQIPNCRRGNLKFVLFNPSWYNRLGLCRFTCTTDNAAHSNFDVPYACLPSNHLGGISTSAFMKLLRKPPSVCISRGACCGWVTTVGQATRSTRRMYNTTSSIYTETDWCFRTLYARRGSKDNTTFLDSLFALPFAEQQASCKRTGCQCECRSFR